jgi:glycyl-tRNA synthetase (class II)
MQVKLGTLQPARSVQANRPEENINGRRSFRAIVSLAKRRGFVYPSSNFMSDYAPSLGLRPTGVELKNNVKHHGRASMVRVAKMLLAYE